MRFYSFITMALLSVLSFQVSANGGMSSESLTARGLSTEEGRGNFPVCFNGEGDLLPCANNDPVPPTNIYVGSWTGRMIYDRGSSGSCWDADVYIVVSSYSSSQSKITSITVIRDSGGLDTYSGPIYFLHDTGSASAGFQVFWSDILTNLTMTLQFNTQGSAQGFWNYDNGLCYGVWTFTKD